MMKLSVSRSPALAKVAVGLLEVRCIDDNAGGVLSTVKVTLGPPTDAKLPPKSLAVPAATEIPNVPSPLTPEIVTVREAPLPVTPRVPVAVPVLLSVMFPALKVLPLKFTSA